MSLLESVHSRPAALLLALAALVGSAAGGTQSEPARGPLRVHPTNPRYFADPSGKAVLLVGSHTWENFQDIGRAGDPPFDYSGHLDLLKSWNHNFIRLWLWEHAWSTGPIAGGEIFVSPMPYLRTGPGNARDGRPKFDLSQFNEAYFKRLRDRIVAARDRGMYVGIILFVSECSKKVTGHMDPCWPGHPYHRDNNINGIDGDPDGDGWGTEIETLKVPAVAALQKEFIKKVVDTVNDLDNVLYEIANESSGDPRWQYEMINFIRSHESGKPKQHPIGMTGAGPTNSDLFNSPADWISPGQDRATYDKNNPPAADGRKVIIPDTDHAGGCGHYDPAWVWKSFLRGHNPIYMDVLMQVFPLLGKVERNNFHESRRMPVRRAMGHTLAYATRVNLAAMTPQNRLASTEYCLANPSGRAAEYLVYLPSGGSVQVDLTAASGAHDVEWFNPATGQASAGAAVDGGASRSFTAPFDGAAVLYLRRQTQASQKE